MSMPPRLVLIGAGAGGRFTKEICDALEREVYGYLDDSKEVGETINGVPVLGPCSMIEDGQLLKEFEVLITLGDFPLRRRLYRTIKEHQGTLATVIHPLSMVSPTAVLGDGVVVNGMTVISANARIGDIVLVEDQSSVGVDCILEDGVLLGNGVMIGGGAICRRDSFLGSGVAVVAKKTVGERAFIGAGAVVVSDIPNGKLAVGVPARVIKDSPILAE